MLVDKKEELSKQVKLNQEDMIVSIIKLISETNMQFGTRSIERLSLLNV